MGLFVKFSVCTNTRKHNASVASLKLQPGEWRLEHGTHQQRPCAKIRSLTGRLPGKYRYSSTQFWCNNRLDSRTLQNMISLQDEIFMFGGKLEGGRGNVTDELWVFNVPSRTWQRRNPVVVQPAQTQIYAVEGHSAHCIQLEGGDAIMLVIFGYSPVYSYISIIQEYNLSESQ